jgi:cell division protein FtsQ
MAQKISRNVKGVRRQARAADTSRRVRKARGQGRSLLGRLLGMLPFSESQLHKFFTVLIFAGVFAFALFIARVTGLADFAEDRFALIAANGGFEVHHVEVRGTNRLNEMMVYERAIGQRDLAMTRVNLKALRDDLLTLPWVKDARVSRQLPDVLVVDIVEREPHAALRRDDELVLIDATGVELEGVAPEEAKDMLVIGGEGAQGQVEALATLLDAAPALRQQVVEAVWKGNRRWDLTFSTGQRLSLPEGADRSAAALVAFAEADGVHRLIGGEVVAFDLRNPPNMTMRVPGRAEASEMNMGEES